MVFEVVCKGAEDGRGGGIEFEGLAVVSSVVGESVVLPVTADSDDEG